MYQTNWAVSKVETMQKKSTTRIIRSPSPKHRTWELQAAKARFSELFRRARAEGAQWVTRRDKKAVVVLPAEEYERLAARSRQPQSLVQFFAESPLAKENLDLERQADYGWDIERS
jgi:prevent-host-death family protein